jgi:riboflavin synthase
MFTGIVQDIGEIAAIDKQGDWIVTVATRLPLAQTSAGASIAHSGICLTVVEILPQSRLRPVSGHGAGSAQSSRGQYRVQLSKETLSRTTALRWQVGARVNLEPALRVGDELGGHYVSGHVDGIARVVGRAAAGDSVCLRFDMPPEFAKFIAAKGSVAIDGVALTVLDVEGARFGVNVIPHTQAATTLGALQVGAEANFEVDMIARYVERMKGMP